MSLGSTELSAHRPGAVRHHWTCGVGVTSVRDGWDPLDGPRLGHKAVCLGGRAAFFCVNYMLPIFILFKLQQAFTLMYAVIISRSICSEVYF